MRSLRRAAGLLVFSLIPAGLGAVAACGARTGLLVEELPDAAVDSFSPFDTGHDRGRDVVAEDVLPPIDVTPKPDVVVTSCADAGETLIYVVTEQNEIMSFDPPTAAFTPIGLLSCPTPGPTWTPFSMAVDRKGNAYVLFNDQSGMSIAGLLYRVSLVTSACTSLPYQPGQQGFDTYGMGFVATSSGTSDTLFIAADTFNAPNTPSILGTLDVTSFLVSPIGPFFPLLVQNAELTGTGGGRLFAFYATNPGAPNESSAIAEIDPMTAKVIANNDLTNLVQGRGWAFGFWGGDFYLFTTPCTSCMPSIVTRYRPSDGSQVQVGGMNDTIVGAGVSTCAPQQ